MGGGKSTSTTAPRLNGINIQSSVFGSAIPRGWGTFRVPANLLWYGDFQAIATTTKTKTGGKGGGGTNKSTTYSYKAALILGVCAGPIAAIRTVYKDQSVFSGWSALSSAGLSLMTGADGQATWGHLSTRHPDQAIGYSGIAYAYASAYALSDSAVVSNHSFEVVMPDLVPGTDDASPRLIVEQFLSEIPGWPSGVLSDLSDYGNYCLASGLLLSPVMTAQVQAAEFLKDVLRATNSEAFMSEGKVKITPYGDTEVTGNGVTWTPDLVPIYDLDDTVFVPPSEGDDPLTFDLKRPADAYNIVQVEYLDRGHQYAVAMAPGIDQASIDQFGARKADPARLHVICDSTVADKVADLLVRRTAGMRTTFSFRLPWNYVLLDPMDLVTVTDTAQGIERVLVRVLEVNESDDEYEIVCEEMLVGQAAQALITRQPMAGYRPNWDAAPGDALAPALINPPKQLTDGALELWIATAGGPDWGGAEVWASIDGSTYERKGQVNGPARYGFTTSALPLHADPDSTNAVGVNIALSGGELTPATQEEADDFATLCLIGDEVIAYRDATLTATGQYTLAYLRRGLMGTTPAAHPAGSPFVRLDGAIEGLPYRDDQVGLELYVKLRSFNIHGRAYQELDEVEPYTATLTPSPATYVPVVWEEVGDRPPVLTDLDGDGRLRPGNVGGAVPGETLAQSLSSLLVDVDDLIATYGDTASSAASASAAAAARDAAETAASNAATARDQAEAAFTAADGAATLAGSAASAADTSAGLANTSRIAAETANAAAAVSAGGAATSATAATNAASAASAAKDLALAAKTDAQGAATAAAGSATTATNQANAAAGSASAASGSATAAASSAGAASGSAGAAATSATSAATQASNAAASASSASASAVEATASLTEQGRPNLLWRAGAQGVGAGVRVEDCPGTKSSWQARLIGQGTGNYQILSWPNVDQLIQGAPYSFGMTAYNEGPAEVTIGLDFQPDTLPDGPGHVLPVGTYVHVSWVNASSNLPAMNGAGFRIFADPPVGTTVYLYELKLERGSFETAYTPSVFDARDYDRGAQAAATASASSASAASAAQTAAGEFATASQNSATNAATSASNASTFASNASTASNTATAAASTATTQAGIATGAATSAGNSATASATSASAASGFADAAGNSASSASTSAGLATSAKNAAQTAESNASIYASNAAGSASDAAGSASTATTQAGIATGAAGAAGGSATSAAGSASAASSSATDAGNSATAANASKVAAEAANAAANAWAGAAATSASGAAASQSAAASSASAASASSVSASASLAKGLPSSMSTGAEAWSADYGGWNTDTPNIWYADYFNGTAFVTRAGEQNFITPRARLIPIPGHVYRTTMVWEKKSSTSTANSYMQFTLWGFNSSGSIVSSGDGTLNTIPAAFNTRITTSFDWVCPASPAVFSARYWVRWNWNLDSGPLSDSVFWIYSLACLDVTSEVAAGGSASAAANSASSAAASETAAGTAASAAQTAQTAAETARGGAEVAQSAAASSASSAAGSASTATTQANLAATARTGAETANTAANGWAGAAASSASAASASQSAAGGSATSASTSANTATVQAGNATNSASAASASASAASSSAAAASASATLSARVGIGTMSTNPVFAGFSDSRGTGTVNGGIPDGWFTWGSCRDQYRVPGRFSDWAFYQHNNAGGTADVCGITQSYASTLGLDLITPGWVVLEADIRIPAGILPGAGVLFYLAGGGSSVTINFATDPDVNGTVHGSGQAGKGYSFRKLCQITSAGNGQGIFHLMTDWDGFSATRYPKIIIWDRCDVRPATDQEVAARRADTNASTALSQIASESSTRASQITTLTTKTDTLTAQMAIRPNLIDGFEYGFPAGMSFSGGLGAAMIDTVWGREMRLYPPGPGTHVVNFPRIQAYGNDTYQITGDSLLFADSGQTCYFDFIAFNASMEVIGDSGQTFVNGSHDFSNDPNRRLEHQTVYTTPAGTAYLEPRFVFGYSGSGGTAIGIRYVKVERGGGPPTAYSTEKGLTVLSAKVSTAQGAITTLTGRAQAWLTQEVNAGAGSAAFVRLYAETAPGVISSDVSIGAREIHLYNQTTTGFLKALSVIGGNAIFYGGLTAATFIRQGSGEGWPVALANRDFVGGDGATFSWGLTFDNFPSYIAAMNNLAPLTAGETYDVRLNVTKTGASVIAKIITPGSPTSYGPISPSYTPGTSAPDYTVGVTNASRGESSDGNYDLAIYTDWTSSYYSNGNTEVIEIGNDASGNVYVDVFAMKSGVWTLVSTEIYSHYAYAYGSMFSGWNSIGSSYSETRSIQMGTGVEAIGVQFNSTDGNYGPYAGGGASLTSASWQAPGSSSSTRSATPGGQTTRFTVIPK